MIIFYDIHPFLCGFMLVGHTTRGLRAVLLGESTQGLLKSLEALLPYVQYEQTSIDPEHVKTAPLDIPQTPFQKQVWTFLSTIAYGTVMTYKQVAHAIGRPQSVRAVARACATNPIAVRIPCHRVVAEDGSLSGYRWGINWKKELLAYEREHRYD